MKNIRISFFSFFGGEIFSHLNRHVFVMSEKGSTAVLALREV